MSDPRIVLVEAFCLAGEGSRKEPEVVSQPLHNCIEVATSFCGVFNPALDTIEPPVDVVETPANLRETPVVLRDCGIAVQGSELRGPLEARDGHGFERCESSGWCW